MTVPRSTAILLIAQTQANAFFDDAAHRAKNGTRKIFVSNGDE
jgi:hypothetical protein